MKKICLVTEELAGAGRSGGIGAAFKEMALLLATKEYVVDILFYDAAKTSEESREKAKDFYLAHGVKLVFIDVARFSDNLDGIRSVSYAIYKTLKEKSYDFIHFHDYKGIGFYSCEAKRQGLAFKETKLVVQLHGPTRWTIEANSTFFTHEDQLLIDFMERKSIEWADEIVSPSAYLLDWLNKSFFKESSLKTPSRVIKNLCRGIINEVAREALTSSSIKEENNKFNELIFFGRHEERKGIAAACDALDLLAEFLEKESVKVSFIGQPGFINGQPSSIYFIERSKNWKFDLNFHFGLDRSGAARYLALANNSLVIIPSAYENSPYTVLEALALKKPILCSIDGGGGELISEKDKEFTLCKMSGVDLSAAIINIYDEGLRYAEMAEPIEKVELAWLNFHKEEYVPEPPLLNIYNPLVTVGITHYERADKVIDAVVSILKQTYSNFEIILVDDGSKKEETLIVLSYLESVLGRSGGKIIRQENSYLGAARNAVLKAAKGEYLIFLDDDDLAMPKMIETLVQAALKSNSDVVSCLNIFMPLEKRAEVLSGSSKKEQVSYFPLCGPLSLSPEQNVFGSATGLLRTEVVRKINGYTELRNVGHEDYELYIRLAQSGAKFAICPEPLFYYEVGRPSMISRTSMMHNFKRCFNALDFSSDKTSWSDYINLGVGRKCHVDSNNRIWWLNSQTSNAHIRNELMIQAADSEKYIELSVRLSIEENNYLAAKAFSNAWSFKNKLAAPEIEDKPLFVAELMGTGVTGFTDKPKRESLIISRELADIRVDLALGRVRIAIDKLSSYLDEKAVLPAEIQVVLSELVSAKLKEEEFVGYKKLLDKFLNSRISKSTNNVEVTFLQLFVKAGFYDKAQIVLKRIYDLDVKDYLQSHADVKAISESGAVSPLDHYLVYGRNEGRYGFNRCLSVLSKIESLTSKRLDIEDLPNLLAPKKDALELYFMEAKI